jgi:hypothetical protein
MSGARRELVFSVVAGSAYTVAYYLNLPLVVYYPLAHELRLFRAPGIGFPILLYGWLATAVLVGAAAACLIPARWARRLPLDLSWLLALALIVAVLTYEKRWFF